MSDADRSIDWSNTTFEGSRREQLRRWRALSLRQRLEALDEMTDLAQQLSSRSTPSSHGFSEHAGVRERRAKYSSSNGRNEIVLRGCTPAPLASYLKALAVLRLVAEQAGDPRATGYWRNDQFVLCTRMSEDELIRFFLDDYQPTPLVAPWNGGSGFYFQEGKLNEKDPVTGKKLKTGVRDQPTEATRTLEAVERSTSGRLAAYREAITAARSAIAKFGLTKAPENETKDQFIRYFRNIAPGPTLRWTDASLILANGEPEFPPLLGTGGNDGNLDFTTNFMQNLVEILSFSGDRAGADAEIVLATAIFGRPNAVLRDGAIGQFAPGNAGGPNASSGFEGNARINPWDFTLMLEGAVLLSASAVRRLESSSSSALSAPFTVRSRLAMSGAASHADDDRKRNRGEIWLPLWSAPCTLEEASMLFAEGRAALGTRPARDALDFARSVTRLGIDRGITEFQRFGFLMRSGKAFLATALARVPVRRNPQADVIDDLEQRDWLARAQRFAGDETAPNAFRARATQLDATLFALTQRADRLTLQKALRQLGAIEGVCSTSPKTRQAISPVPPLSTGWAQQANDGSAEFSIAAALAGLSLRAHRDGKSFTLTLRPHFTPVTLDAKDWNEDLRLTCWGPGSLERNLIAVLHRRRLEALRLGIEGSLLHSQIGASLEDVLAFLDRHTDDMRISELLTGLVCVDLSTLELRRRSDASLVPPPAYALFKPFFTAESTLRSLKWLPDHHGLSLSAEIPARLASNDVVGALRVAWQRLRALGVKLPGRQPPRAVEVSGPRLLTTLMIPLRFADTAWLLRSFDLALEHETRSSDVSIATEDR